MVGNSCWSGRDSTRTVMLTICRSFVPVRLPIERGLARTS